MCKLHLLIDLGLNSCGAAFSTELALQHTLSQAGYRRRAHCLRWTERRVVCLLLEFVTAMLHKERDKRETHGYPAGTFEVHGAGWKAKSKQKQAAAAVGCG